MKPLRMAKWSLLAHMVGTHLTFILSRPEIEPYDGTDACAVSPRCAPRMLPPQIVSFCLYLHLCSHLIKNHQKRAKMTLLGGLGTGMSFG